MRLLLEKNKQPIIKPSLNPFAWDGLWAYHPCLIEKGDQYYLFYTGKSFRRGIAHQIGVALSANLKNWEKLSQNPVLSAGKTGEWDSDFVAHAFVFKEKGRFYMLYDGSKKGVWQEAIGLAESNDLIHWKKNKKNPIFQVGQNWWEKRHVSRCSVFKKKDAYHLYYAGHDGERERIGAAQGKSLLKLERILNKPVLNVGKKGEWDSNSISDPKVLDYNGRYLMFYSGLDQKGIERMGLAISNDLLSWKKYQGNPILDVSPDGRDKISASRVDVKIINDKIYLFYSGRKKFFYNIGQAEIKIR